MFVFMFVLRCNLILLFLVHMTKTIAIIGSMLSKKFDAHVPLMLISNLIVAVQEKQCWVFRFKFILMRKIVVSYKQKKVQGKYKNLLYHKECNKRPMSPLH